MGACKYPFPHPSCFRFSALAADRDQREHEHDNLSQARNSKRSDYWICGARALAHENKVAPGEAECGGRRIVVVVVVNNYEAPNLLMRCALELNPLTFVSVCVCVFAHKLP